MFCIFQKLDVCLRGLINSSCFIKRGGRCEQGHGRLEDSERFQSSLHVPGGQWGWGLVEGDDVRGIEWDPLHSLTSAENIF